MDDGEVDVVDGVRLRERSYSVPYDKGLMADLFPTNSWEARMVRECQTKLAVRPTKAHAILFYSQHPDGSRDGNSRHGGCPVLNGTKWAANLWIWNKVRLGYAEAPRKKGAPAFDAKKGFSRDRLHKNQNNGEQQTEKNMARSAVFMNHWEQAMEAQLYWEDSLFSEFPPGKEIRVNTFIGHEWNVRIDGEIVQEWSVSDTKELQVYRLTGLFDAEDGDAGYDDDSP